MGNLAGKVALITGGARGLGLGIAQALGAQGAGIVIGDILDELGEQAAADLRANGVRAQFVSLDVCDDDGWSRAAAKTVEFFGGLDILVNNAGIATANTIEDTSIDSFRRVFDINLFGAVRGMQVAIPLMKQRGGGAIINISSNSTVKVNALTTEYSASKAAVASVTKSAAIHLAQSRTNIRVNSVHPGPQATEMLLGNDAKADMPIVKQLIDSIPMGRMGQPADVGAMVAFLASDQANYLTAAEFFVDGGVTYA